MKILITGSNGQLGSELRFFANSGEFPFLKKTEIIYIDINDLDLSDSAKVSHYFSENQFEYIINCAAYTQVDKAEEEKDAAYLINVECLQNIVKSISIETKIIHISTDYVFDGKSYIPYTEESNTNPQSIYGSTKLEGEKVISGFDNSIIIRTSWLYSVFGKNFVKTIDKLSKERDSLNVVFDQVGTPTNARELAKTIWKIINQSVNENHFVKGIYHFSNEGICSWYDFAKAIVDYNDSGCIINPIESKEYPTPAKRPFYSVLNKQKIKSTYNIEIPHWLDSLKEFFNDLEN